MDKGREEEVVRTTAWSGGPGCHGGCGAKVYVRETAGWSKWRGTRITPIIRVGYVLGLLP